jgi:hypothetical protein
VTETDPRDLFTRFGDALSRQDWAALAETLHPQASLELPQSGERFSGRANILGQFQNYPALEPGSTHVEEVIGEPRYAVSPMFTLLSIEGSGNQGVGITRVRYPDGSSWWAVNVFDVRDGMLGRMRAFFAEDFEPPAWRAPYRDGG